ncbi:MAG: hypothetical protein LBM09_03300, partial [Candidatus Nomurabacteria bacterium]|nr:hypothetical protein [Candidatus Nomurabacteria bacterium]
IYFTSYQGGDRAIEFDIATVASNEVNGEVEGKTEGSIRVLSASFGGKKSNKYKQNNVSRIKFGVNIREGKNE